MSEITRGVMGMPYEMAMESELSRRQFYSIAKEVCAERDALKAECEGLRKDARRWQCVRNAIPMQSPYAVWREGSHVVLGKDADDLVDNFLSHSVGVSHG